MQIIDQDIKRFPNGTGWFNSSIIRWKDELIMAYRHADNNRYLTNINIAKLDGNYQVSNNIPINIHYPEKRFYEDPRLFTHKGKLWLSYIMAKMTPKRHIACQRLCELDDNFQPVRHIHPQFGSNVNEAVVNNGNWDGEKNWVFYSWEDEIYSIYSMTPTKVLKIHSDGSCKVVSNLLPKIIWNFGRLSGSTQHIEMNGMMYGAFHSFTSSGIRNYHMGFYEYDPRTFCITKISRSPFLSAFPNEHEDLRPKKMGWRPNCIFPCGIEIERNNILVSYGWQDCRSKILILTRDEMMQSIEEVDEHLCEKECVRDQNICFQNPISLEVNGIIYRGKSYNTLKSRLEKNNIDISKHDQTILDRLTKDQKEMRWVKCF